MTDTRKPAKTDFSYLKQFQPKAGVIREFTLHDITLGDGINPILVVKPATEDNKAYINEALKKSSTKNLQKRGLKNLTAAQLDEVREEDIPLFAKLVIVGWKNVVDADGKSVEFSTDECENFIGSLPSYVFDGIREFCNDVQNFIDVPDLDLGNG